MASGETLAIFKPREGESPSSNYATADLLNNRPVLRFDPTTDEEIMFSSIFPRNYGGSGITVYIHYVFLAGTGGNSVVWQVAFERIQEETTYLHVDNYAALQSSGADSIPSLNYQEGISTITFSNGAQIDDIQNGDYFRLKLRRDADSTTGTDDADQDALFLALELKET